MQPRPGWSQLDEFDHICSLLSYVLDQRRNSEASQHATPAQLFGVVVGDTGFSMMSIDLDAQDPVADVWALASTEQPSFALRSTWSWVLVVCETRSGDDLAVAVSVTGATLIELRSHGLATLRSSHPASGVLVDACTSLLQV